MRSLGSWEKAEASGVKTDSAFTTVYSSSYVRFALSNIRFKWNLADFIAASYNPPKYGDRAGAKCHLI